MTIYGQVKLFGWISVFFSLRSSYFLLIVNRSENMIFLQKLFTGNASSDFKLYALGYYGAHVIVSSASILSSYLIYKKVDQTHGKYMLSLSIASVLFPFFCFLLEGLM